MSMTSGEEHIPMSATERTRTRRRRMSTEERRRHAEERRVCKMQRRQSDPAIREQHSQLMRNPSPSKAALFTGESHVPGRHTLSRMDTICIHCSASHFAEEKKRSANEFDQCCNFGNVRPQFPPGL
ncbi:hypothetical protein Aduo_015958 [Ancylostoma duodenale]